MGSIYAFVRAAQNGNYKAKEQLYRITCNRAYYVVSSLLGDDEQIKTVMINSYCRVYREISQVKIPANFEKWFFKILTHQAVVTYKEMNATGFTQILCSKAGEEENSLLSDNMPTSKLLGSEGDTLGFTELYPLEKNSEVVQHIYKGFTNEQLFIMVLRCICGLEVLDIAEAMGIEFDKIKNCTEVSEKLICKSVEELQTAGWALLELAPLDFGVNAIRIDVWRNWYIPKQFANIVFAGVLSILNQEEVESDLQRTLDDDLQKTRVIDDLNTKNPSEAVEVTALEEEPITRKVNRKNTGNKGRIIVVAALLVLLLILTVVLLLILKKDNSKEDKFQDTETVVLQDFDNAYEVKLAEADLAYCYFNINLKGYSNYKTLDKQEFVYYLNIQNRNNENNCVG